MKAIILETAGGVENLKLQDIEKPFAEENEVLVGVKAISINPADVKLRAAEEGIQQFFGDERPVILGWDIAGVVSVVGDKVSDFEVGDNVFGMVNFPGNGKAYAEFVTAPKDQLAKMPENISFEEAAATTLAALTALQVLQNRVKKDDRVLIHGGSGGVGHFAIQIAKYIGAYVVTTASAKNKDFVMSLGADEFIDYRTQKFEEVASDIDLVLDGIGGEVLTNSLKVLSDGGTVISLPSSPQAIEEAKAKATDRNVNVLSIMVQSSGEDMNTLRKMLEIGVLKPNIYKTFPFAEMRAAHTEVEKGSTVGKIIITL